MKIIDKLLLTNRWDETTLGYERNVNVLLRYIEKKVTFRYSERAMLFLQTRGYIHTLGPWCIDNDNMQPWRCYTTYLTFPAITRYIAFPLILHISRIILSFFFIISSHILSYTLQSILIILTLKTRASGAYFIINQLLTRLVTNNWDFITYRNEI